MNNKAKEKNETIENNNKSHEVNDLNTDHESEVTKHIKESFKSILSPLIEHIEVVHKCEVPVEVDTLIINNFAVKKSVVNFDQWECLCPQCLEEELTVNQNHEWKCSSCSISGVGVLDLQEIIQIQNEHKKKLNKTR